MDAVKQALNCCTATDFLQAPGYRRQMERRSAMRTMRRGAIALAALFAANPAAAQNQPEPDRSDPAIVEQELERPQPERPRHRSPEISAPSRPSPAVAGRDIVVGAVHVQGAERLPIAAFSSAIEPFLARALSQDDLVRLATAVAGVARRAGYGLATAWVPAQELTGGILTVQVEEGRIDAVRATGPASAWVERQLVSLTQRSPVSTAELERQLLLAGDLAGISLGEARLVREGDRNILVVASRYQPVEARITLDDWGSEFIGPVRASAEIAVNGVARAGDDLTIGIATTPLAPATFQLLEARYRLPLGGRGTTVAVGGYYGHSDVESDSRTAGFRGDSWEVGIEAFHPLERSRARSLWLSGRFELRDSALARAGRLVRDDRIASATASLYGYDKFAGGRLRMRAALVQGLDLFDATRPGDPLASRANAGGVFTKFEGWAEFTRPLAGGFSAQVAARGQLADGPLLSSEEMGLGGPQFLRAFDYRELSGDQGAAASTELRLDLKNIAQAVDKLQFYGYADIGRVGNLGGTGRSGSLASAGGGVRVGLARKWEVGIELGIPLTDGAADEDPAPRFSFSLRTRF
jgi:hemolysin activation/secretion protein